MDVPAHGVMGVAIEGDAHALPQVAQRAQLAPLESYGATSQEVVVFNRGGAPFTFEAKPSQPWLRVTPASGKVTDASKLRLDVDWKAVPPGTHAAELYVRGSDGTEVHIDVPVRRDDTRMSGFIESRGVVAIEAAHYARKVDGDGVQWTTIPNLGRTLSAVTALPATAPGSAADGNGPRLE